MSCIDEETLAAFVEGTLDAQRRREVMEHLERCEECTIAVGLAAESLREEAVLQKPSRWPWLLAAAAVLATAFLAIVVIRERWLSPSPIGTLVAAAPADRREVEPRLSGGFAWAEYRGPARDPAGARSDARRLKLQGAAGDVLERAAEDSSAGTKHAAGIALLLVDDADESIQTLNALAAKDAANDASVFSDLAAAYYATGRAALLPQALAAADRALAIDARLPEALFNRALVLERMGLLDAAGEAWKVYLKVDATSPWAVEAREHHARLTRRQSSFERDLPHLSAGELVARYPQQARTWGEGPFLAEWAEGRTESLARARAIGDALAERSGETMLRDAVAAIDRAKETRSLAEAHLAYHHGRIAYSRRQLEEAVQFLTRAAVAFERGGSPMAAAARYFAANVVYDLNRTEEAYGSLTELLAASQQSHRALRAQILWQRALACSTLARWSEGLADAEAARAIFDALGEDSNRAFVDVIIAEMLEYAEDAESAWERRTAAFAVFSRSGAGERLLACLGAATRGEVRRGNDQAARALAAVEIEAARHGPNQGLLAVALFYRALLVHRSGEGDPMRDLAEARAIAPRTGDARRVLAEIDFAEGVITRANDPARAIELLSRSADFFRESFPVYLPAALLARGRAHRDAGRLEAAFADFTEGIESIGQRRGSNVELETVALFDDEQNLFGGLVDVALTKGAERDARAVADRALQRALRSRFPSADADAALAVVDDDSIFRVYVAGEDVIVFSAGEAARAGRADHVRADARALVAALASRKSEAEVRARAASLHALLIAPFRRSLAGLHTLVVVADPRLGFIPFPALFDATSGRYLIEDFEIVLRPAAALPLRERAVFTASSPALIVGNPLLDDAKRLPGAEREAHDVAATYRAAHILAGRGATLAAVEGALSSHRVFHYAGHAAAAERSAGALLLANGRLYANDIARLDLRNLDLVVLAACRSSRGAHEAVPRDLATAFVVAGARNVVGTGWEIDDATSAATFAELHRGIVAGTRVASAVRGVQLAAILANRHPSTWAAITVLSTERS
jgi:CHAT domain-containing protein